MTLLTVMATRSSVAASLWTAGWGLLSDSAPSVPAANFSRFVLQRWEKKYDSNPTRLSKRITRRRNTWQRGQMKWLTETVPSYCQREAQLEGYA